MGKVIFSSRHLIDEDPEFRDAVSKIMKEVERKIEEEAEDLK